MDPSAVAALADRLRTFRFEAPGATPFAQTLARTCGWDLGYAQRVVEEYRRFLWLAGVSDERVSPPEAVDEAWHMHLLDTRSYWGQLCPDVLGRALHHEPGRGGVVEHKQLESAYARTFAAYREAFGEPPADIWPPPGRPRAPRTRRVAGGGEVVLSRRALAAGVGVVAAAVLVATAP